VPSNDRAPLPPLRPVPPEKPRGSLWAVLLALMFGLAMFIGLVFLAGALGPIVAAIGGLVLILLAVSAGHYLLWGYWLSDSIRREVEEEDQRQSQEDGVSKKIKEAQDNSQELS
jgi:hypothetical protein